MKQKMKFIYGLSLFFLLLGASSLLAQTEGLLKYNWNDTVNIIPRSNGSKYNEVWGFKVNGIEYGIIGSTMGAHFINLSDPNYAYEEVFVRGKYWGSQVVHRDFHDYKGYLYAVCDQGSSSLQVIDLSSLPDTIRIVHEDSINITTAHNVFVDSVAGKLYTCGVKSPNGSSAIQVWSLEDPSVPVLLNSYNEISGTSINYVHDAFARGDTVFMNAGTEGLFVADFSDSMNPQLLGTLSTYEDAGFNHSGWLNERGDRYYMADETWGMDIKIIDVSDLSRMYVIKLIEAESDPVASFPHNLIVKNDMLYVSYNFDGLQVFDVSGDTSACRTYYYSTSGFEPMEFHYRGAWGVYPLLPSELILVSDRQEGLFVIELPELEQPDTFFNDGTPLCQPISTEISESVAEEIGIYLSYMNGRGEYLLSGKNLTGDVTLINSYGQVFINERLQSKNSYPISIGHLNNGVYLLNYRNSKGRNVSFSILLL